MLRHLNIYLVNNLLSTPLQSQQRLTRYVVRSGMLVSFNTTKGHGWSVVGDVLLSCSMSTFHQQLSMYNNQVSTWTVGGWNSLWSRRPYTSGGLLRGLTDLPRGSWLRDGRHEGPCRHYAHRRYSAVRGSYEIVTDSFYICNKYINVINLILFSLSRSVCERERIEVPAVHTHRHLLS